MRCGSPISRLGYQWARQCKDSARSEKAKEWLAEIGTYLDVEAQGWGQEAFYSSFIIHLSHAVPTQHSHERMISKG